MEYWLFKSEPSTWSWKDQVKKGKEGEGWDGVRNYQANYNMKKMKIGDLGFFYHSVKEKQIVGIVRVIGEHRPDPTDKKGIYNLIKEAENLEFYINYPLFKLLEETNYLETAYNQVQEKADNLEPDVAAKFLSYPIPKAIVEEWEKVK